MGTEICGMDYVFPPNDFWFGSDDKNFPCAMLWIYYWYGWLFLLNIGLLDQNDEARMYTTPT